jgi:hypothetical protein
MYNDPFLLNDKTGFFSLFWEIYNQEKSSKKEYIIAVQKRKEALLKENTIALIDSEHIRKDIANRIYLLKKKNKDTVEARNYASENNINIGNIDYNDSSDMLALSEDERLEFCSLKSKLQKSDGELVLEERARILHQPLKTHQEYLEMASNAKSDYYKKWSSVSYRGIGAGIGAAVGAIVGTVLFPGLGTGVGAVLGGGFGGIFGLVVFGLVANHFIVNRLIPLSNAYNQASQIKKIIKKKERERFIKGNLTNKKERLEINKKKEALILGGPLHRALHTIYDTVKAYIHANQSKESYSDILTKFSKAYLKSEATHERNALYLATIENTLANHYNFEALEKPLNSINNESSISKKIRNSQKNGMDQIRSSYQPQRSLRSIKR